MKYYFTFLYSDVKEYNDYLAVCRVLKALGVHFTTYSDVDDDNNDVYCIEVNCIEVKGRYIGDNYEL